MIILRRIVLPQPTTPTMCYELAGTLSGTISGSNQIFYTEYDYAPGTITVFYNGQALYSPEDFTETGPNEITFNYIVPGIYGPDEVVLRASYKYLTCSEIPPSSLVMEKGQQNIVNGVDRQEITFNNPFPDTNYALVTNLINLVDVDPPLYPYITGIKSASGFTVFFQEVINSDNYVVEWIAVGL